MMRNTSIDRRGGAGLLIALLLCTLPCRAAAGDAGAQSLEEPAQYGVYYDRYEPAFYTGFAPRTRDPRRLHLHLGRGNQLRATVVLSDDVLQDYAADLLDRYRTYRALIDDGHLVLTQNRGFDDFERTLHDANLERVVTEEATQTPQAVRARNLELLERLNPGRIFRIRMAIDELMRRWVAQLRPDDRMHMDTDRRLELVNLMLPTRLFVADLDPAVSSQLAALVQRAPQGAAQPADLEPMRPAFEALLDRVSHGIYPLRDGALQFSEFTAVYPVGTWNEYTIHNGRQIPAYPTPGRRALTTHQRTLTIDHVPTDLFYSYFPWLPYMHVGDRLHNAIHTLFWTMKIADTSFLPPAWRSVTRDSRNGEPYEYLWLLSRGPMSHGCTHLNAGHISELRQLLPAESDQLDQVDLFLNTSILYDVFDIDGDFAPEVMGVRYFIAYSLKGSRPDRLRVRDERGAYYDWLYGGELQYDEAGQPYFRNIRDGRFIERRAVDGTQYDRINLHEAAYEPEKIQLYRFVDIPFTKELRKVGLHHPFPGLGNGLVQR
jgi:hypothetical protein